MFPTSTRDGVTRYRFFDLAEMDRLLALLDGCDALRRPALATRGAVSDTVRVMQSTGIDMSTMTRSNRASSCSSKSFSAAMYSCVPDKAPEMLR